MKYTVTLADTSDPTGQTTERVEIEVDDSTPVEEAMADAASNYSRPDSGLFYMPVAVERGGL